MLRCSILKSTKAAQIYRKLRAKTRINSALVCLLGLPQKIWGPSARVKRGVMYCGQFQSNASTDIRNPRSVRAL